MFVSDRVHYNPSFTLSNKIKCYAKPLNNCFFCSYMIRHGVFNLNQTRNKGQTFEIQETFTHPKYNGSAYYDIAVLQIAPVTFNVHLRPICLPNSSNFNANAYDNDAADLIGWGSQEFLGKTSTTLRRAILKIHKYR